MTAGQATIATLAGGIRIPAWLFACALGVCAFDVPSTATAQAAETEDYVESEPDAPPPSDQLPTTEPAPSTQSPDSSITSEPVEGSPSDPDVEAISGMSLEELLGLEIHVTAASLFDESSLDAAASVDVITEDDWSRRGARRTLDAVGNQPSTTVYPTVWGGSGVAIRGYASGGSNRGVAIQLDGVPLNDMVYASALHFSSNVELPTLSRIEMIRGPGSALYGTDAFHGVLAYRSFSPESDRTDVGQELGTDLFHRSWARTSRGLGEDLRLNVAFSYSELPNQSRSYAYTDPNTLAAAHGTRALSYRSLHGTASLAYAPRNSRWDASLALHANHSEAAGAPGFGRASDARSLLEDADVSGSDVELYLGRAQVGVALDHQMRIEALGYFWYQDAFTNGPATVPTVSGPSVADTRTDFAQSRSGTRVSVRQEMSESRRTQWVAGYEYSRGHLYSGGVQTIRDPTTGLTFRSTGFVGTDFTRNIHSLFLSAQTRFANDVVRIHYGGRIDHYSDFGFQVTPRVGVVVTPVEGFAIKALYGRAFRAPSVFEIRGDGAEIRNNAALGPELIDTFELVLMRQTERYRLQASAFASIWHDAIILVPISHPSFATTYENAGSNHAIGGELSGSYVRSGFRIDASASYVMSRNDSVHVDFSAFPALIGNFGVGYSFDEARVALYLFQRLQAVMTQGDPVSNVALRSQPALPAYYRVDFQVDWEAIDERLHVFLNVRNALARRNQVPSLANAQYGAPTQGINASIGLTGSF